MLSDGRCQFSNLGDLVECLKVFSLECISVGKRVGRPKQLRGKEGKDLYREWSVWPLLTKRDLQTMEFH